MLPPRFGRGYDDIPGISARFECFTGRASWLKKPTMGVDVSRGLQTSLHENDLDVFLQAKRRN